MKRDSWVIHKLDQCDMFNRVHTEIQWWENVELTWGNFQSCCILSSTKSEWKLTFSWKEMQVLERLRKEAGVQWPGRFMYKWNFIQHVEQIRYNCSSNVVPRTFSKLKHLFSYKTLEKCVKMWLFSQWISQRWW